jgi:hypothetical protein
VSEVGMQHSSALADFIAGYEFAAGLRLVSFALFAESFANFAVKILISADA